MTTYVYAGVKPIWSENKLVKYTNQLKLLTNQNLLPYCIVQFGSRIVDTSANVKDVLRYNSVYNKQYVEDAVRLRTLKFLVAMYHNNMNLNAMFDKINYVINTNVGYNKINLTELLNVINGIILYYNKYDFCKK